MSKTILERIGEIKEMIEAILGARPSIKALRVAPYDPSTGWFKIRAYLRENTVVDIYEYRIEGEVYRYSYALIVGSKRVLRYDNAPHHPEVETFPHHKHVGDRVEPLHSPSIEAFLEEAKNVVEQRRDAT